MCVLEIIESIMNIKDDNLFKIVSTMSRTPADVEAI